MDDLDFSDPVIFQTLKEIDTINAWLGGNNVTMSAIKKLLKEYKSDSALSIADLGCGSGEMLRKISHWANKKGLKVQLVGIDANPHIVEYARKSSVGYSDISYHAINIFSSEFEQKKYDIITCTLFCHHFDDESLSKILSSLSKSVSIAIVINDIHRHWFAYYSIKWLTSFFSKSYMVKYDSRLSVLKAFKRVELENILKKAEIKNYIIKWKWAFRYQLVINRLQER